MAISISVKENKGGTRTTFVEFSECPPELISLFRNQFPLFSLDYCASEKSVYRTTDINYAASINTLHHVERFAGIAVPAIDQYGDISEGLFTLRLVVDAIARKYSMLSPNIHELRTRFSALQERNPVPELAEHRVLSMLEEMQRLGECVEAFLVYAEGQKADASNKGVVNQ